MKKMTGGYEFEVSEADYFYYKATFIFILNYFKRGLEESDDLRNLLSAMNLDVWEDGMPIDPVMWQDWLDAIHETRDDTKTVD